MDVAQMLKRKNDIIGKNAGGISFLFKKNEVANVTWPRSFTRLRK